MDRLERVRAEIGAQMQRGAVPSIRAAARKVEAESDWQLPIVPAPGTGVVTRSCEDRSERYPVAQHVGRMLRIGGEVRLCFDCGPEGGVYHPDTYEHSGLPIATMATIRREAERIFLHDGDGSVPPTDAELAAFDAEMRRALGKD